MARLAWLTAALLAGLATPALADVKSGVDAWTRGDYKRAVDEWRAPAVAGDADAQFNLGQAYKLGRGVPLDPALARSWFLKAANQGHVQAADNYGLALFEDGQKAAAAPWLERSAARYEKRAQLVLGTMLFNGDGVPRDYPRAYALMTRASQQGLKSASETLAQMDQYISPADRQAGTALAQRYAAEQQAYDVAHAGATTGGTALAMTDGGLVSRPASPAETGPRLPSTMQPVRPYDDAPPPVARPRTPTPRPAVAAKPKPAAPAAPQGGSGAYKVQLGAFRDAGNARSLWARVSGKLPGARPIYAASGGVTRLQAGPYPDRAAAARACAIAGGGCVVVAP